jgi:hypothetical protein
MALVLFSWGSRKPDQLLVDLMLEKAKAFHVIREPKFVFGSRWPQPDGSTPSYDSECWHIRDDLSSAAQSSRGMEMCQILLEGLEEGFNLASPRPARKKLA